MPLQLCKVNATRGSDAPPARSASEDGRGGEAALRLEKRIHLDKKQVQWQSLPRGELPPSGNTGGKINPDTLVDRGKGCATY